MGVDWSRPLADITILEITRGIAASFAARLFAQLGATVHRVQHGELSGVPREAESAAIELQRRISTYVHDGKIIHVAKDARGVWDTARALINDQSPALFIEDLGLTHRNEVTSCLGKSETKLLSVSPLGESGPYANWACDPLVLQSLSGIATLVGLSDREPLMLPGYSVNYCAGAYSFITGMALILDPVNSSKSASVTELEVASTLHQHTYLAYTRMGWVRKRGQFMLPTVSYFSCSDGDVVVAAVKPGQWHALAVTCDRPELLVNDDLATFLGRRLNTDLWETELAPWFQGKSCQEAFAALCDAGVPAAVIQSPHNAVNDPQFASREFISRIPHSEPLPVPFLINSVRPGPGGQS